MDNEYYMGLAIEQARQAFAAGEFPVGCVIVQDGHVLATGARFGTAKKQAFFSETDHAEIRALRDLENQKIWFDQEKTVVFSTMEPCLMCLGAIIISGIKKIVYAYEDPMGGATSCDLERLNPLYAQSGLKIVSGVLRQKSLDLFYDFFNKESNQYWKGSFLEKYTLGQKKAEDAQGK